MSFYYYFSGKTVMISKNDGNDSSWETILEKAFQNHLITYKKQYSDKRYPYKCDFYAPVETIVWSKGMKLQLDK